MSEISDLHRLDHSRRVPYSVVGRVNPYGRAATAQAEAEAVGIAHANANNGSAYLGRKPSFTREQRRELHVWRFQCVLVPQRSYPLR
jgi:hypothetical protein